MPQPRYLKLIQSFRPTCGVFLGASHHLPILRFLEDRHQCPPPSYDPQNQAADGRCRINQYFPK